MERAKERVAIMLNNVGHSAVIDFGCVGFRILWIKFKFSRVKICVVVGYGPSEGDGEERDRFCNNMDRVLDKVDNGYRVSNLGDLNGCIGDRVRTGISGAFGVPGENDTGRRVVDFCAESGLCIVNTYFEHRSLHEYTRVAKGQDGVKVKSMIVLVLVKKDMLHYVPLRSLLYCVTSGY